MGTWTYFVAYRAVTKFGNAVTTRPRPINSRADVEDVERWISSNGAPGALITHFLLLRRSRFGRWRDDGTTVVRASREVE